MELHGTVEFVSGSSRYCFSSAGCLFTLLLAVFRQPSSNGAGKAGITHDFLSLHKERPLQNSRPPPSPGHVGGAARGAAAIDLNVVAASVPASSSELGFGRRIVKPELSSCGPSSSSAESAAGNGGGATAVFRQRSEVAGNRGGPHPPQWPSTSSAAAAAATAATAAVAHGGVFPPSSGQLSSRDAMDASSRLKGFADEEEEDEEEFMRDTPSRKGLTVKVDGGSNSGDGTNDDRKPSTPRSKHSATEQRRRSKINDRFQILRNLIPNTDQKRDKASFLLEVIEYIQVLQEKVNKYESPYPVWNQDNAKLTPWKSSQAPDGITAATTNPLVYPMDGGAAAGVPLMPATLQQFPLGGTGVPGGGGFGFFPPQARTMSGPADHGRVQWPRPSSSSVASAGGHGAGGDAEDLVIDEGTVSLSSAYSDGLLSAFTEALEGSGLDLSQASISVRINLGRQALRPFSATAAKDAERSSGEDSEHQRRPAKRRSASGGSGG